MPRPRRSGLPETRPLAESICVRVPSRALVTQTERSPVASRSGPWPIAIGSETETPLPPSRRSAPAENTQSTARIEIATQGRRRAAARRSPSDGAGGGITAVGLPGVSESTRVAAGVAPSRSRAASISPPAVG